MKNRKNKIWVLGLAGILVCQAFFAVATNAVVSTSTAGTTTVTATVPGSGISITSGGDTTPPSTADTTAPSAISNLAISNTAATSVTLTWTAVGDDSQSGTATAYSVRYTADGYIDNEIKWAAATVVSSPPTPSLAGATQTFVVSGLNSSSIYYFSIKAVDEAGNWSTVSNSPSATTLSAPPTDITPPIISNIVATPHITYIVITWTTDEPADSQIAHGLTNTLGAVNSVVGLRTSHSVTLGSLASNTKYYYAVRSTDATGNQGASATVFFVTLPDTTPPANVSGLTATVGDRQAVLHWQNPGDADFSSVVIRRSTTGYPQNVNEGVQVYSGTAAEFANTGLTNSVLYYYTVFSRDVSNNYASGALVSITPTGDTPPPPPPPPELPPIVPPGGEPDVGPGGITPPAPPTIGSTVSGLSLLDLELFTARRALRLTLSNNGSVKILSGQDLIVSFNSQLSTRALKDITLKIGESSYLMATDRFGNISADVTMPTAPGSYSVLVAFEFQDGAPDELRFIVKIEQGGWVYTVKNNEQVPVSGAEIVVYKRNSSGVWELWNADAYHQTNPQIAGENGGYAFVVPNGEYFLRASHDGYRTQETGRFTVSNQVINLGVELIAIPAPLKIDLELPIAENIKEVAKNLGQKTVFVTKVVRKEVQKVINNPEVKKAVEQTAAPVVTGVAVASTVAVAGTQIFNYLQFLFTQPILFFFRRKRKGWGMVYNSLTKMPVDLAIVRLIDVVSGRITQSRVTDKEGRYAFIASPGRYKLELNQDQFVFPTKFLAELKEDGIFVDIYHGEVIEVKEQGALITANVPLDPVGAEKPIGMILRRLFLRKLQNVVSAISILVSMAFVYITPGWLTGGLLIVQVLSYILFRRFAVPPKPKSWGIIYDEQNKQPLASVVARIFDKQYNKLLETQITDAKGRYSFLVGSNEYYITYEKNQYEKKTSAPIDLRQHSESSSIIGVDAGLKKIGVV